MESTQEDRNIIHLLDYDGDCNGFKPICYRARVKTNKGTVIVITNSRPTLTDEGRVRHYDLPDKKIRNYFKDKLKLIEYMYNIKIMPDSNNYVYFNRYRRINGKVRLFDTYKYRLKESETVEAAMYVVTRLYPNFYIKLASTDTPDNQNMDKDRKKTLITTLRKSTGGGMAHCNKAIIQVLKENESLSDTDVLAQAEILLAEARQVIASKKTNNKTNFFRIKYSLNPFDADGVILKFGCESEQGMKKLQGDYDSVLNSIVDLAVKNGTKYAADALSLTLNSAQSVGMKLDEISGILSEKVELVSLDSIDSIQTVPNTFTEAYIHPSKSGDKTGGLLIYNCKDETKQGIARKILQQIVFSNPLCLAEKEILPSIMEEVKSDINHQIDNDNALFINLTAKKENKSISVEEIDILKNLRFVKDDKRHFSQAGKLKDFVKLACLEEQVYIFPEEGEKKKTVKQILQEHGIQIFDFVVAD